MTIQFSKATRKGQKLRMALLGPSGGGKTMTALKIARGIVGAEGRIAVLDTERGSASKYSDLPDIGDYETCELESFSVENYIAGINAAEDAGFHALVIDSLSHAWSGKDGLLEFVDATARKMKTTNSFAAWRDATPKHNMLVDAILGARMHIIVTMRVKTEYLVEKDDRGKSAPRKVGLQPVQRDGLEYEFDVVADIDLDHFMTVSKTRCMALDGKAFLKPNGEVSSILREWLDGAAPETPKAPAKAETIEEQILNGFAHFGLSDEHREYVLMFLFGEVDISALDAEQKQSVYNTLAGWTKDRTKLDEIIASIPKKEAANA